MIALLLLAATPSPMLRAVVSETALAQTKKLDPAWHPAQRDCAGFVRFVYRSAYLRFDPKRVEHGLWKGFDDRPIAFADAETLLANSFVRLGRDAAAARTLESGDLVAFRQRDGTYHLMLAVRTEGTAAGETLVVYHPGDGGDAIRVGRLAELVDGAPQEWRPVDGNGAFLGFFRFEEWSR
ncbi:MAG: DUF1175 family protein [Deltaproteobacteria bacterium]